GTLRRNPDLKWRQTAAGVLELQAKQTAILASAQRLVKAGGRLVYATCSILPEENEAVAEAFSAAHPDFVQVPVADVLGKLMAAADGIDPATVDAAALCSGPFLRLWPHRHNTDGFFAAVWERKP
ncbi:MAG: SAM-dependent methyltransferase, partial [Burkholderiales bacterium]|nr:SAM-dependent methyltransferase [Burkholderiales bacterium]